MCALVFLYMSETFLIVRRVERGGSKMCVGLHVKCRLFWSGLAGI